MMDDDRGTNPDRALLLYAICYMRYPSNLIRGHKLRKLTARSIRRGIAFVLIGTTDWYAAPPSCYLTRPARTRIIPIVVNLLLRKW